MSASAAGPTHSIFPSAPARTTAFSIGAPDTVWSVPARTATWAAAALPTRTVRLAARASAIGAFRVP